MPAIVWNLRAALVTLLLFTGAMACSGVEPFSGTPLSSANPAAPFELENQFGRPVKLSDHRGKVVLLTFLYTSCPDVCPITASHIKQAYDLLGGSVDGVAFLAVSVDPEGDSTEDALAFSEKWEMARNWDYLVGDREHLAPIWNNYYIDPAVDDRHSDAETQVAQGSDASDGGAGAPDEDIAATRLVIHSPPVYLIDREGLMRVVFTLPFEPAALAHDLEILLSE
jgi:protein SCO1/2